MAAVKPVTGTRRRAVTAIEVVGRASQRVAGYPYEEWATR